jgi:hypothetical protein
MHTEYGAASFARSCQATLPSARFQAVRYWKRSFDPAAAYSRPSTQAT